MYDLKIQNALLITGDGRPAQAGSLAVKDGRISKIAPHIAETATKTLDAQGHAVSPGFIDMHTHATHAPAVNLMRQGCTTLVGGACGFSHLDFHLLMEEYGRNPAAHNMAFFIGHNTVRKAVMGDDDRQPTAAELEAMKRMVARAMQLGAIGLSVGLAYAPGCFSKTDEVVELAKVAAAWGGFYDPHQRVEGTAPADVESLEIARKANLPLHISHYKVQGLDNAGRSRELLAALDAARASGMDVTLDQYPYTASCGRVTLLFPTWACAGDNTAMIERLQTPELRERIKEHLRDLHRATYGGDGSRVLVSTLPAEKQFQGKTFSHIAQALGHTDDAEGFAETALYLTELGARHERLVMCVYRSMSEEDIERIMQRPYTMIGSDAWGMPFGHAHPHPRAYGTFPRVIGHYGRERGLFSVEEAVHKMTGLTAKRLRLPDRGLLREDWWADITVFDPDTIIDTATFEEPHRYPRGIDHVIVNGQVVVEHDTVHPAAPGVFLRRPG